MNRTGARRKAGCAQERSVPRRTGRRAAIGETVPARRGILFLGEPAGVRRGASRFGQPCRRWVCPQGNSRTGCPAKGRPARKSALFLGEPAGARRSARQRPRTGAFCFSANRQAAQGRFTFRPIASAAGLSAREFPHRLPGERLAAQGALHVSANRAGGGSVCKGIPAQAARRKAGRAQGRFTFRTTVSAAGLSAREFPRRLPGERQAAHRGASRFGQLRRRRVCPQGIPAQGVLPSPPFRIEARRPAIRDRPARPRDTP